jgi:hypothetical protein
MERLPLASRQDLLTIVSTEHFTLQGARSAAISDANRRTSFFLSTLSAGGVALAFVAQVAQVGTAFIVLALILLPSILAIGLASVERLLQLGIENIRTVVAIPCSPLLPGGGARAPAALHPVRQRRRPGRPDQPRLDSRRDPAMGHRRHECGPRGDHRRDRQRRPRRIDLCRHWPGPGCLGGRWDRVRRGRPRWPEPVPGPELAVGHPEFRHSVLVRGRRRSDPCRWPSRRRGSRSNLMPPTG